MIYHFLTSCCPASSWLAKMLYRSSCCHTAAKAAPSMLLVTKLTLLCPACSWLGKMKHVKQLLVDDAPNKRPQLDALANAYIYLQVLSPN